MVWDETHAAIIRSMVVHEDDVTNHRMTWLVTLHGFLFAALGFAWKDGKVLIPLLGFVGVFTSLSIMYHLFLSHPGQSRRLVGMWESNKPDPYDGPDVIGHRTLELTREHNRLSEGKNALDDKKGQEGHKSQRQKEDKRWLNWLRREVVARVGFPWFLLPLILAFVWSVVLIIYYAGLIPSTQ